MFACMKLIHVTSVMLMELDNLVECPMLGGGSLPIQHKSQPCASQGKHPNPHHSCLPRQIHHAPSLWRGSLGKGGTDEGDNPKGCSTCGSPRFNI